MTLQDRYGNALSTSSAAARDCYDAGLDLFLGANVGASAAFGEALDADPSFALGHAALARATMMEGRIAEARAAIARAEALAPSATPREQAHVAALSLLIAGQPVQARAAVLAHVADHPRDALIAQLCTNIFGLIGFSGESGREAQLLAFTGSLLPHYGEDWWMMCVHAVSLCETGQIAASMALMDRALALNPRNAHGAHFKAHAQYEAGETAAGRRYLADWMGDYDRRAVLHGHLSWHGALWALHDGDEAAMWQAVDASIAPGAAQGLPINVLTDTAAILYRADLAGFTVRPDRWAAVSDYAARFFPDPGQSFADLHAALAHAMAGNGDRLDRLAGASAGFAADLIRPLARAFGAIARGQWRDALDEITPVLATAERVGGSRAQRDLIELAHVHVLMKLGLADEARRALLSRRPVLAAHPPVKGLH